MKHKKKKINLTAFFSGLLLLLSIFIISTIYKFNGIENNIRFITIFIFIIFDIFIFSLLVNKKSRKKKNKMYINAFLIVVIFGYIFLYTNLNQIYSFFTSLNKNVTYTASLVTLSSNDVTDAKNIKNEKIGISNDLNKDATDSIIESEHLNYENEILTYETYPELITALLQKEVTYIILPSNYADTYKDTEEFGSLSEKVKTITTSKEFTKEKEELKLSGSGKEVDSPFTMLLMGIDSTTDGFKNSDSFNGDTLILLTFNPKTMNMTMLNIPRDSYVPISCFPNNEENKITHAAAKGTSCVIETIENFLDVKIDYYVKINFTGLVELVDALGGIEVDVPYNLCEQNSKRQIGDKTIYIRKGVQTLNGEEALAFARNRKKNEEYCSKEWTSVYRDEFTRQENQQNILKAMINKAKNVRDLQSLKKIMSAISNNIDTNMEEDTIFSFYNLGKDIMLKSKTDEIINIIKLYIDGQGQIIYDERTKLNLWDYVPHKESVEEVSKAMKINLGEIEDESYDFSFSYGEEYNPKPIGKGPYKIYFIYDLLPKFTEMNISEAKEWAEKYNVTLDIKYVSNGNKKDGTIVSQNYPYKKRVDKIDNRTVTIEVVKNESKTLEEETKVNCLKDVSNSICSLPNFVGKSKSDILSWANKFSNTINIFFNYEKSDKNEGVVLTQDQNEGTKVSDLINKNKTVTFTISKK